MGHHVHGILVIDAAPTVRVDWCDCRQLQIVGRPSDQCPAWYTGRQRGYYDHIVRNDQEMETIRRYIRDNPARWANGDRDPSIDVDGVHWVG